MLDYTGRGRKKIKLPDADHERSYGPTYYDEYGFDSAELRERLEDAFDMNKADTDEIDAFLWDEMNVDDDEDRQEIIKWFLPSDRRLDYIKKLKAGKNFMNGFKKGIE